MSSSPVHVCHLGDYKRGGLDTELESTFPLSFLRLPFTPFGRQFRSHNTKLYQEDPHLETNMGDQLLYIGTQLFIHHTT